MRWPNQRFGHPVRTLAFAKALGAYAIFIALSGCVSKPAPLDNAYCRLYVRLPDPSDAVHMKKRENKLAVLTNEQTWLHECGHSGTLRKGPT